MGRVVCLFCLLAGVLLAELPSVIVIPQEPTAVELTAAKELSHYLGEITGRTFGIVPEGERPDAGAFLVGATSKAKQRFSFFEPDAIALVRDGENIFVTGHPTRGVLYAVYVLLEEYAGVNWFAPDATVVPKNPDLDFPELNLTYAPPIRMREPHFSFAADIPYNVRMKNNGHFPQIPAEYGGHEVILGFCHTFGQFLPASQYFEAHPEWYALNNGKRVSTGHYQFCLTNEEMTQEMIRVCLEKLKENPDCHVISVSQNDGGTPCQCEACKVVEEEEGGTAAGPLVRFVNKVAAAIEKEYPDVFVETLAYTFTRKAPTKTRPARNVIIRYCDIEADFSKPIDSDANQKIRDDINAWAEISTHLYNWHYISNFSNHILPEPTYFTYQDNIRFYLEKKSVGMFMEADGGMMADFEEMRYWVIAHLLWNPSLNQEVLIQKFLQGYYGAAAPYLRRYLELITNVFQNSGCRIPCYRRWVTDWLRPDTIKSAVALYEAAEKAVAEDAVLLDRVKKARLSLDLACFFWYPVMKAKGTLAEFPIHDWVERADHFSDSVKKYFIWRTYLVLATANYATCFSEMVRDNSPVPPYCEKLPKGSWVDYQEYMFGIVGLNKVVTIVDDPLASNGRAARMQNKASWCIQMPLPACFPKGEQWRVCANVRFVGGDTSKAATHFGIYDESIGKDICGAGLRATNANAEGYTPVFIGSFPSSSSLYIYIDPSGCPDDVQLMVDNITLLRE